MIFYRSGTLFDDESEISGERDIIRDTAHTAQPYPPLQTPPPWTTEVGNVSAFNPLANRGKDGGGGGNGDYPFPNPPNGSFNPDQDRSTSCNSSESLFKYEQNHITRIVFIPSFILLLLDTILLIYTIIRFLKKIIKLYFSVLFYAICQAVLLISLIASFTYAQFYADTMGTCRARMPLQTMAILLPGFAVFVITVARFIFLKYPMKYRDILSMKHQMIGFLCTVIFAGFLANLPNFGLCSYELKSYGDGGLSTCEYSKSGGTCAAFYAILIGIGFVLPPVGVAGFYTGIYMIIIKHRDVQRKMTTTGSTRDRSTTKTSVVNTSASESLMGHSTVGTVAAETEKQKVNKKEEKERSRVPWSILVILFLHILSTLPWIPQELYPELLYGCQKGEIVLLLDLMWTVLLVSVSCSPLAYLLTTPSVREQVKKLVCGCCKREGQFDRIKNMSNV